jgi:N-acetylglucosamine malate deacetylase 1
MLGLIGFVVDLQWLNLKVFRALYPSRPLEGFFVTLPSMNILAIFAHPDDEIACLGTLAKHAARGDTVKLVWTTYGELASQFGDAPAAQVRATRETHGKYVAEKIGASYQFFDMGDSRMQGSRDEALQLARLYAEFQPDAVITWDDFNRHPDHRATAKIAFNALTFVRIPKILNENQAQKLEPHRKPITFYQYVASQSNLPLVHVDISSTFELALHLRDYYAEFYKWAWSSHDFTATRAAWGQASGVKYAERFTIQRSAHPALEYLM